MKAGLGARVFNLMVAGCFLVIYMVTSYYQINFCQFAMKGIFFAPSLSRFFQVHGKCGSVRARLIPAPRGSGIVGSPVMKCLGDEVFIQLG